MDLKCVELKHVVMFFVRAGGFYCVFKDEKTARQVHGFLVTYCNNFPRKRFTIEYSKKTCTFDGEAFHSLDGVVHVRSEEVDSYHDRLSGAVTFEEWRSVVRRFFEIEDLKKRPPLTQILINLSCLWCCLGCYATKK